jgi:hypothetical protein
VNELAAQEEQQVISPHLTEAIQQLQHVSDSAHECKEDMESFIKSLVTAVEQVSKEVTSEARIDLGAGNKSSRIRADEKQPTRECATKNA